MGLWRSQGLAVQPPGAQLGDHALTMNLRVSWERTGMGFQGCWPQPDGFMSLGLGETQLQLDPFIY